MLGKLSINSTLKYIARRIGAAWSSYNREILLREALGGLSAYLAIDVGCADGSLTYMLPSLLNTRLAVGIDIQLEELSVAVRNHRDHRVEFICADAHMPPFRERAFDLILMKDLLHHVENPLRCLNGSVKILKPGGYIVIIEPLRGNPLMDMYLKYGHNHFTRSELITLLRKAKIDGYCVKEVKAYPHHLLFWSGRSIEILWDMLVLIFLFATNLSRTFRILGLKILPRASYQVFI